MGRKVRPDKPSVTLRLICCTFLPIFSAFSTSSKEGISASSDTAADLELDAAMQAAIKAGELPDTQLSKMVFKNSMRFPDAIVLTRVGKFYEVCYPSPITE